MFIYPISFVLILLNILPDGYAGITIFRIVVSVTFIFSIPDFLKYFLPENSLRPITELLPLADQSLGWILPAIIAFIIGNVLVNLKKNSNS